MNYKSTKISYCVSFMFMAATFSLAVTDDAPTKVKATGRLGAVPTVVLAGLETHVKLKCDIGNGASAEGAKPSWSFRKNAGMAYEDLTVHCVNCLSSNPANNDSSTENDDFPDCNVCFSKKDPSLFVLELDDVDDKEFGDYVCHMGDIRNLNSTFYLRENVTITRLSEKGKPQKSVTLDEGELLDLHCSVKGRIKGRVISWWKDDENITDQLRNSSGLFENFHKSSSSNSSSDLPLAYSGTSKLEHRGHYKCRISDIQGPVSKDQFLTEFTVFMRVKESDRWQLPMYILLGEVALIGLFTIFITIKEKRAPEDEADGQYDDSDDEDEMPAAQNGNGVQNNNGNTNSNSSSTK